MNWDNWLTQAVLDAEVHLCVYTTGLKDSVRGLSRIRTRLDGLGISGLQHVDEIILCFKNNLT